MLPIAQFGLHVYQDHDGALRETVRRLCVLLRNFLEVLKPPHMRNLGES